MDGSPAPPRLAGSRGESLGRREHDRGKGGSDDRTKYGRFTESRPSREKSSTAPPAAVPPAGSPLPLHLPREVLCRSTALPPEEVRARVDACAVNRSEPAQYTAGKPRPVHSGRTSSVQPNQLSTQWYRLWFGHCRMVKKERLDEVTELLDEDGSESQIYTEVTDRHQVVRGQERSSPRANYSPPLRLVHQENTGPIWRRLLVPRRQHRIPDTPSPFPKSPPKTTATN